MTREGRPIPSVRPADYHSHYYSCLAPSFLSYVAIMGGFAPPRISPDFAYCELGCGQGTSTLMAAATAPNGLFWGIDHNPDYCHIASDVRDKSGLRNLCILNHDFRELATSHYVDLPDFDFIALHGIWSWIGEKDRRHIIEFISRKLKSGGVLYVSYNALPGTNAFQPMRWMFYQAYRSAQGGREQAFENAVGFMRKAGEAGIAGIAGNANYKQFMERITTRSLDYVHHEFLVDNWESFYHFDVSRQLREANLEFAGPTNLIRFYPEKLLQPSQQLLQREIDEPSLADTFVDYCCMTTFRQDVYVKSGQRLSGPERDRLLGDTTFVLLHNARSSRGPLAASNVQKPIVDALDETSKTLRELCSSPSLNSCPFSVAVEGLASLVNSESVAPLPPEFDPITKAPAQQMNQVFAERAFTDKAPFHLAAPLACTGIRTNRFDQFVLHAIGKSGKCGIKNIKTTLLKEMRRFGVHELREFADIEFDHKNREALARAIGNVVRTELPNWRRLGVIPSKV